ncbi:MAG: AmmeMemoRadiSam system protein B [Rhodobacterales bacterium]|nr:AmmeMemoRadiSam system protein B [Rhodobacterales bacterium]
MGWIRQPAVAGMFYPGDPRALDSQVHALLSAASVPQGAPVPKALIAPHAGYVYSGPTAAEAYARLAPARGVITRVVLLGPCHRVPVRGLALSGAEGFATPLGTVPVDAAAVAAIADLPQVQVFDETHAQEHSLEVHLPFLQTVLGEFSLVPLVVGQAPADEIADVLERLWGGPETLIVVSSDLSHYLPYDACREIDARTCSAIEALDIGAIGRDQACGRIPVGGLLEVARRRGLAVETLDLRTSGDTAGDKARVVGYGAWAFTEPAAVSEADRDFEAETRTLLAEHGERLLRLAAAAIEQGLINDRPPKVDPATLPPALAAPGAAFVTLKIDGRLRGCIGSPQAHRPLGTDVADNAFGAAFRDPRFPRLTLKEKPRLALSIAVLSPAAPLPCATEAELLAALRPGVDGLILQDGPHRALFLPAVWADLPDPAQFVGRLKQKAGLGDRPLAPGFKAWRFITESVAGADLPADAPLWQR